jgi:hypothetical protein
MKRISFLLALVLFALTSTAGPVAKFSMEAPTHYDDGTVIPATDILNYTIYCSKTMGGPYDVSWDVGTSPVVEALDLFDCVNEAGNYYFVATATSSALGTTSAFSNEISKFYSANQIFKKPNPPVLRAMEP